ncbi:MAG: MATE family efflux transporter [Candidatus Hydrogenedentes bacterium]|nr:MATE family efflux transporter [Candidatus Hydrogenedentota bacterium]
MKQFDREIVSGNIFNSLWKLTWPLVLLNLVNGLHGFIDQILVGHFVKVPNNAGNAAIGVSWQVFMVVVVFIASLSHGMNVLIARYSGRQDRGMVSLIFFQSLGGAIIFLVFIVAPIGYFLAPALLNFIGVERDVYELALPYLRLLFVFNWTLFLLILVSGAIQASGFPKIALALNVVSSLLNVLISFVLITGIGIFPSLGVMGAGIGTVMAPAVALLWAWILIVKGYTVFDWKTFYKVLPQSEVLKVILRVGVPTGIQGVVLNLGGVLLIKFLSTLPNSTAVLSAYTICYNQLFSFVTWTSFGLRSACGTVMGQNIGAGNPERGRRVVRVGAYLGSVWGASIGFFFIFFPGYLLNLFDVQSNELVFEYGRNLLQFLAFSAIFLSATLAMTGGIQGAGATQIPMIIAMITQLGILLGSCTLLYYLGSLTAYRVWGVILLSHIVRYFLTLGVFRSDRWMHTRVEVSMDIDLA